MDFFIKRIHINSLITPALFIGGNLLYSYVVNKYLRPIKIPEPIIDVTKKYINKAKDKFIKTFDKDNADMNTNIDKEFYVIENYISTMKDINNKLDKKWKIKTLCEYTPKGNIIMYYDPYKQGFSYYSDAHPISYEILNSVAMRYVTMFKCRDFFVDDEMTPEGEDSAFIKIHMTEKPTKKDNSSSKSIKFADGPFAQLKKNNKKNTKDDDPSNPTRVYFRNKFICMGRMRNYSILTKPTIQNQLNGFQSNLLTPVSGETKLQKEVMNYKSFKNTQLSK
jgi:hypothetical protein